MMMSFTIHEWISEMGTHKIRQKFLATNPKGDVDEYGRTINLESQIGTPGITIVHDKPRFIRQIRLDLTDLVLTIPSADDFAGVELFNSADVDMVMLEVSAKLRVVKGNTANGITANRDIALSIGWDYASDTSLSGDASNLILPIQFSQDLLQFDFEMSSLNNSGIAPFWFGIANTLILNASAAGMTANDTLTFTGVVVIVFYDRAVDLI